MSTTTTTGRKVQKRTQETRARLLEAAIEAFATVGFDGASAAAIEKAAGVKRGLLAYHFESKDGLWRAAVDELCGKMATTVRLLGARPLTPEVDPLAAGLSTFIRGSAEIPELQRIIFQESGLRSDRMNYLIDAYIGPIFTKVLGQAAGRALSAHDYYIMIGAAILPFSAPQEALRIWNVDPFSEAFIEDHVRQVTALLRGYWTDAPGEAG